MEEIDIFSLINGVDKDLVIEEVPQEDVKSVVAEPLIEEVVEELDTCPVLVDISGAVKTPGVYCFKKEASVIDAVKKANGFTKEAGFKYISMKINLATKMVDNGKIYIPFEQDYDCQLLTFSLPKEIVDITIPSQEPEESTQPQQECVSINSATTEQLETLDGVGPSTATKIIEGRPYTQLEDLLNVSGIGEATFNKFKDFICL
jgi:competence protein ComEA